MVFRTLYIEVYFIQEAYIYGLHSRVILGIILACRDFLSLAWHKRCKADKIWLRTGRATGEACLGRVAESSLWDLPGKSREWGENDLTQAKTKLCRERCTALWEWQLSHGLSASKHLLSGCSFPSIGWNPWDQNRVHQWERCQTHSHVFTWGC